MLTDSLLLNLKCFNNLFHSCIHFGEKEDTNITQGLQFWLASSPTVIILMDSFTKFSLFPHEIFVCIHSLDIYLIEILL